MRPGTTTIWVIALGTLLASGQTLHAEDPKQIVQQAVNAELAANHNDNSHWRYVKREGVGNTSIVVETENGAITRRVQENGKPASAAPAGAAPVSVTTAVIRRESRREPSAERRARVE